MAMAAQDSRSFYMIISLMAFISVSAGETVETSPCNGAQSGGNEFPG